MGEANMRYAQGKNEDAIQLSMEVIKLGLCMILFLFNFSLLVCWAFLEHIWLFLSLGSSKCTWSLLNFGNDLWRNWRSRQSHAGNKQARYCNSVKIILQLLCFRHAFISKLRVHGSTGRVVATRLWRSLVSNVLFAVSADCGSFESRQCRWMAAFGRNVCGK